MSTPTSLSHADATTLPEVEQNLLPSHIGQLQETWQRALEKDGYDGAWVSAGNTHLHFQDDHGPEFKAHPYFTQWVDPAFAQPGAHLLIRPDHAQPLVLFTPQPTDYWHTVAPTPAYLQPHVEIRSFESLEALGQAATKETQSAKHLAYIGESNSNELAGQLNPENLLNRLDFGRATKSAFELELMRKASVVGARGHLAAAEQFYLGGTEFDIHMAYLMASQQSEIDLPYGNIVALNEHAATLHYQAQDRLHHKSAKSLLIDAGGQHRGYASDITRTYAAEGDEHADFRSLIQAMQAHQDSIISSITVGQTFADLHEYMHRNLCEVLVNQGILTCSSEEAFASRLNEAFCPHGLGHLLGIQVHDVGGHLGDADGTPAPPAENYPSLRFTRQIEPDQVFTIEPGLYFIDSLLAPLREKKAPIDWHIVDALHSYGGIRIEDNVRVLPDGVENLTRDAFAQLA